MCSTSENLVDVESDSGRASVSDSQPSPSAIDPLLVQQQLIALLGVSPRALPCLLPQYAQTLLRRRESATDAETPKANKAGDETRTKRAPSEDVTSTTSKEASKRQPLDYAERRRRNNDSARRSREVRRQRELDNRMRSEALEKENVALRQEITQLRTELTQLAMVIFQKTGSKPIEASVQSDSH